MDYIKKILNKIVVISILVIGGLIFFANKIHAVEGVVFKDGNLKIVTVEDQNKNVWLEDGLEVSDDASKTVYVKKISVNGKTYPVSGILDNSSSQANTVALRSFIKDHILTKPGYHEVKYDYVVDQETGSLVRTFIVLKANLTNNNTNISNSSIIWGGSLINGVVTDTNNAIRGSAKVSSDSTVVVGNKGDLGFISLTNDLGNVVWSELVWMKNGVDGYYPTVINSVVTIDINNYIFVGSFIRDNNNFPFVGKFTKGEPSIQTIVEIEEDDYIKGELFSIIRDIDGDIYTAGYLGTSTNKDAFVFKINSTNLSVILKLSVVGSKDEEFKSLKEMGENLVLVGYTSSKDLDDDDGRLDSGVRLNGTGGLLFIVEKDLETILEQKVYLDSLGSNSSFQTIFEDVIYNDLQGGLTEEFAIVGSTNYENQSGGSLILANNGKRDGLFLIIKETDFKIKKALSYGTTEDDSLFTIGLAKINNGKYRYIAGGNNDSNGYLFEYNIENDSFLGSRLISLESTSKSIDKNIVYDIFVKSYSNVDADIIADNYIVLGTYSNQKKIEGIYIDNKRDESGESPVPIQNFLYLIFENGVFENTNKFTIETNFGYPLPEKEMVDFEVYIKEKLSIYYDGTNHQLEQEEFDLIDFYNVAEPYLLTYNFKNKRDISYFIPKTIQVITLIEVPQIQGIDEIGISKYYIYNREKPNYEGQSGRDIDRIYYDYEPAYSYINEDFIDSNFYFQEEVGGVTQVIIDENLHYKNLKGEYIKVLPTITISTISNLLKANPFPYGEGDVGESCYVIDFFGDYTRVSCPTSTQLEEGFDTSKIFHLRYEVFKANRNNEKVFYKVGVSYFQLYVRKESYQKTTIENRSQMLTNYGKLYFIDEEGLWTETQDLSKGEYVRLSDWTAAGEGGKKLQDKTAFQSLEEAKRYALAQEMLKVKKYNGPAGKALIEGTGDNVIYYFNDGTQAANIVGQDYFYAYYIDLGLSTGFNKNLCGGANVGINISCANYYGYAFSNMAEIEKVAKKIIEGKLAKYETSDKYGKFIKLENKIYTVTSGYSQPVNHSHQELLLTEGFYQSKSFDVSGELKLKVWEGYSIEQSDEVVLAPKNIHQNITINFGRFENLENTSINEYYKGQKQYTVQYCRLSSGGIEQCGEKKTFFLDYTAPKVEYVLVNNLNTINTKQLKEKKSGDNSIDWLKGERDIRIKVVEDIDNFAYLESGTDRFYTNRDAVNGKLHIEQSNTYVYREYEYLENEDGVISAYQIRVTDRAGNTAVYRFKVGKSMPGVEVTMEDMDNTQIVLKLKDENGLKNDISALGVYFSEINTKDEIYIEELSSILLNSAKDYYETIRLRQKMEEDLEEGEELEELEKIDDISMAFSLEQLIEDTTYTVERGIYKIRIIDTYGNISKESFGIGLVNGELDFYFYDRAEPSDENKTILEHFKMVTNIGAAREEGVKYYLYNALTQMYELDESDFTNVTGEHFVEVQHGENGVSEFHEKTISIMEEFNKDDLPFDLTLVGTIYENAIKHTITNKSSFVRFILGHHLHFSILVEKNEAVDDYGFFLSSNNDENYSCLIKIVGRDYEIEEEDPCAGNIFRFVQPYLNEDILAIKTEYEDKEGYNYLIIGGTTIEGMGTEELVDDFAIHSRLKELGMSLKYIDKEQISNDNSLNDFIEDFYYIEIEKEENYLINVGSNNSSLNPISKVLLLDKTPPKVKQVNENANETPIYENAPNEGNSKDSNTDYFLKVGEEYIKEEKETIIRNDHFVFKRTDSNGLYFDLSKENKSIYFTPKNTNFTPPINSEYEYDDGKSFLTIVRNGQHEIEFIDLAGNIVTYHGTVDRVKPIVNIAKVNGKVNYDLTNHFQNVVLDIIITDENLESASLVFNVKGEEFVTTISCFVGSTVCESNINYNELMEETAYKNYTGTVTLYLLAFDKSGNQFGGTNQTTEGVYTIYLDNIAPTISFAAGYNNPLEFGEQLTSTQLNDLVEIESINGNTINERRICDPLALNNDKTDFLYKVVCRDVPSNKPIYINSYEANGYVSADTYTLVNGVYQIVEQVGGKYPKFESTREYYKFVLDETTGNNIYDFHYVLVNENYVAATGSKKQTGIDYYFKESAQPNYPFAKLTAQNYTKELDDSYKSVTLLTGWSETDLVNNQGINTQYYIKVEVMVSSVITQKYILDPRVYQKSDDYFDFNKESSFGRPIILQAEDMPGNKANYYLNTIIKIVDKDGPIGNITSTSGKVITKNNKTAGWISNDEIKIIFDEPIYKYNCIAYKSDGSQSPCTGITANYFSVDSNLFGTPKGTQNYYFAYENEGINLYALDNGNKILPIHYILNVDDEFEEIGINDINTSKVSGVDYYTFNAGKNKQLYTKTGDNFTKINGVINYEFCKSDGCYSLEFNIVNNESQINGETTYYSMTEGSFSTISNGLVNLQYCASINGCYIITNEEKEEMKKDNGNSILNIHRFRDDYNLYEYSSRTQEFNFNYDGDEFVRYEIWAQDFSENISIKYNLYIDKQSPDIDGGIKNDKIVFIKSYDNIEYNENNYQVGLVDNLDVFTEIGAGKTKLVEYKKYMGLGLGGDTKVFNLLDIINGVDFNSYWSNDEWTSSWETVVTQQDIYTYGNVGIYIALYRVKDSAGNTSEYKQANTRTIIVHEAINQDIKIYKYKYKKTNGNTVTTREEYFDIRDISVLPLLIDDDNSTTYEIIIEYTVDKIGESRKMTYVDNNGVHHATEETSNDTFVLNYSPSFGDGKYTVFAKDGENRGSYISRGKYFGNPAPQVPIDTGLVAYNVAVCKEGKDICIGENADTIQINSVVRHLVTNENVASYGKLKDYNEYDYFVIVDEYKNGILQLSSRKVFEDDGTIIIPGHYIADAFNTPVDISNIGKGKEAGKVYNIALSSSNFVGDESETFILVRSEEIRMFNIDNIRPNINFEKAQDIQKPFYMVVTINDLNSVLVYKISEIYSNDNPSDITITVNTPNSEFVKIIKNGNSWDVYFYQDGVYRVKAVDKSGNESLFGTSNLIGFIDFVIDNIPPSGNLNFVREKATGINFWYAVPSGVYGSPGMQVIYESAPEYVNGKDYYQLDENLNRSGYKAFSSQYEALEYLVSIYDVENIDLNDFTMYLRGIKNGRTKGESTNIQNYQAVINELEKWIIPVFSENMVFTDEIVNHVDHKKDGSLQEYIICKIGPCLGMKIPLIIQKNNSIALQVSKDTKTISYYLNALNIEHSLSGWVVGESFIISGFSDGIVIFKESDLATRFKGAPANNDAWYAYMIKNSVSVNNNVSSIEFVKYETTRIIDDGTYILEGHFTKKYVIHDGTGTASEDLFIRYVDNNNKIKYINYNTKKVLPNHYAREYEKVEANVPANSSIEYYKPIMNGANEIIGFELDSNIVTTTLQTYVLSYKYRKVSALSTIGLKIGENKTIFYEYYFQIDGSFIKDEGKIIPNFFYETIYVVVTSEYWNKKKEEGVKYYYISESTSGGEIFAEDGNPDYMILPGHTLLDNSSPYNENIIQMKVSGVDYYINAKIKIQDSINANLTAIKFVRKNEGAYLKLSEELIDRLTIDNKNGDISIYSYYIVKIESADALDHQSENKYPLYNSSKYVLASSFFEIVNGRVVPKLYELEINKYYRIKIKDRVGNEIIFEVSLNNQTPLINEKDISYGTKKIISIKDEKLTQTSIVVVQYMDSNGSYITSTSSQAMTNNLQSSVGGLRQTELSELPGITFKGRYRIRVTDLHGNVTEWFTFSFNPVEVDVKLSFVKISNSNITNDKVLTKANVFATWDNIENSILIERRAPGNDTSFEVYCQSDNLDLANPCSLTYEYNNLFKKVYDNEGKEIFVVDGRNTYPYNVFTSSNFIKSNEGDDEYEAVSDGQPKETGKVYYVNQFTRSNSTQVGENDFIEQTYYAPLIFDDILFNWQNYNDYEYYTFDANTNLYKRYVLGSILNKYVKTTIKIKPLTSDYKDIFKTAKVEISQPGHYKVKVTNRFDNNKSVTRTFIEEVNNQNYFTSDQGGKYILGEHYILDGEDNYVSVDYKNQVGKLKDPLETYYFLLENNNTKEYIPDNGGLYISKSHYWIDAEGKYTNAKEADIGQIRIPTYNYYIRQSVEGFEIDKQAPAGYNNSAYIIYEGSSSSDPKHLASLGDLVNGTQTITLVKNKSVRLIWNGEEGVRTLKYNCIKSGTIIDYSVESFNSFTDENGLHYYYDFIYNDVDHRYDDRIYELWLVDKAGNEGLKYRFEIKIERPQGYIYYLEEAENGTIEKTFNNGVYSTNIGNLRFNHLLYSKVDEGVPFVRGLEYYTKNNGIYVKQCSFNDEPSCLDFDPTDNTTWTTDNMYVKNTVTVKLGDVYFSNYADYLARMDYEYEIIRQSTETKNLQFIITDNLTGYFSSFSIDIDIAPPAINISLPRFENKDGVAGGNLYAGDVVITVDSGSKGYLYDSCEFVNNVVTCDEESIVVLHPGIENKINKTGIYKYHSIDDAGNDSITRDGDYYYFQIDNKAPTLSVKVSIKDVATSVPIAQGAYTNNSKVLIQGSDNILQDDVSIEWRVRKTGATTFTQWKKAVSKNIDFEEEGYYKVRAIDYAGNISGEQIFIIDRTAPILNFRVENGSEEGSRAMYNGEIIVSSNQPLYLDWETLGGNLANNVFEQKRASAPIIKVTVDGISRENGYRLSGVGEHNIVAYDLAGNINSYRVAINNTNQVCINNQVLNVKNQYMYKADNITFTGMNGYEFNKDDIIIFARPIYDGNVIGGCNADLISYMVLDENSFYEVKSQAGFFNSNPSVRFNLDSNYFNSVAENGGYVYAFVIEKSVAEIDLALPVSKFFFAKDPLVWTTVFVVGIVAIYGVVRIFIVRKKVKLL